MKKPTAILLTSSPRGSGAGDPTIGDPLLIAVLAVPLMLAALLVIETARWHMTRQVLSMALLVAALAASSRLRAASSRSIANKSVTPGSQPCCVSRVVIWPR